MRSLIRLAILTVALQITVSVFSSQEVSRIPILSEEAEISLMTCGPGTELYSMFGHSALWVYDPIMRIDRIYNYGTFDFSDSGFYYKFVRGIANYKLSVTNSRSFFTEYISEDRTIEKQVLSLQAQEKQVLFETLEENYLPENRYYRYDFLFLNCSSIIRDKVFESLDNKWEIDSTEYDESFRDLLQPYIHNSWISLGINVLLGHRADIKASNWDRMFLPDHMRDQFEFCQLSDGSKLAPDKTTLYLSSSDPLQDGRIFFSFPLILAAFLFLITGLITSPRFSLKRWNRYLDSIIFSIAGLMGLLLAFMWLFSEHKVTHENLNLLWAFPVHLIFAIALWFRNAWRLNRIYAKIALSLSALFLIMAIFRVQEIPVTIIIVNGILMLRLFRYSFFSKMPDQI